MTPEQAKALQKLNALERSKQAPRRHSSQASGSEPQSEVAETAPTLYQVPKINVPEDLQEVAKLIQGELQKIEQSQSILLSIWEKVKDQYANQDGVTFDKPVNFAGGLEIDGHAVDWSALWTRVDFTAQDDAYTYTGTTWGNSYFGYTDQSSSGYRVSWATNQGTQIAHENGSMGIHSSQGISLYADGADISLNASTGVTCNAPMHGQAYQTFQQFAGTSDFSGGGGGVNYGFPVYCYAATDDFAMVGRGVTGSYHYTTLVLGWDGTGWIELQMRGDGTIWFNNGQLSSVPLMENYVGMSIALTRQELKAEIYAELLALNPGIAIPQND